MSRSRKKISYCGGSRPYSKKRANKKVRHSQTEEVLNGGTYKKLYCQWDVKDSFEAYCDFEEYWQKVSKKAEEYNERYADCEGFKPKTPDKKKEYKAWYKAFVGK